MDRFALVLVLVAAVTLGSIALRFASRRRHALQRIDPKDVDPGEGDRVVVVFTSPYCHGCQQWVEELAKRDVETSTIDIGERPEAAARYRISATPRVAVVRRTDGEVLREFTHYSPREHDLDAVTALMRVS